ncbi:hypothetical protein DIC78_15880 [Bacillus halotolerans]|uniref:phage tail assembly chaperone n=1 Tax=Bacillus subtilis group TaxID=653685 RepID=UPI0002B40381|nr:MULTISPECIES: phage tail assembly chaperone [Bacillus subtilis group]AGE62463.1 hypothetical protein C663_0616 [Bacillus subtilis XF-1]AZV50365.1 hypothetical protein DIC78_15880 [Bacillus halotolerans]
MAVRKIEIKKSYEEVEIGDSIYQIPFDDDSLKKYESFSKEYYAAVKKLEKVNVNNASDKQLEQLELENERLTKQAIEMFLGEGTYSHIYEQAGRSVFVVAEIVFSLLEVVEEKFQDFQNRGKKYYTK